MLWIHAFFFTGEGWDMGTGLAPEDKAKKDNAAQLHVLDSLTTRSA